MSEIKGDEIMSEGGSIDPSETVTKWKWGRLVKQPKFWGTRRSAIWACPRCNHVNVKTTMQRTSNRYYPISQTCKSCNVSTRNIAKHTIQWLDSRKDAKTVANNLNDAKGLR